MSEPTDWEYRRSNERRQELLCLLEVVVLVVGETGLPLVWRLKYRGPHGKVKTSFASADALRRELDDPFDILPYDAAISIALDIDACADRHEREIGGLQR